MVIYKLRGLFELLTTPVELPSADDLRSKQNNVIGRQKASDERDCATMFRLMNQTMQLSLQSENRFRQIEIPSSALKNRKFTDVRKCGVQYEEYVKALKERDVRLQVVDCEEEANRIVTYDGLSKNLRVHTRLE